MARLTLSYQGVVIHTYPLEEEGVLTIGRHADADIQLDDAAVSSEHAQLVVSADPFLEGHLQAHLEDLDSTNGTLVNNRPISRHLLKNGDIFFIGRHRFSYLDDGAVMDSTAIYLPDHDS